MGKNGRTPEQLHERKARFKRLGLCAHCGSEKERASVNLCDRCTETKRAGRERRVADGYCIRCKNKREQADRRECDACIEKRRARDRNRYQRRKTSGLCVHCQRRKSRKGAVECDVCKRKHRQYAVKQRVQLKEEVFAAYGGACNCCGETEPLFLSLDHVNNDGAAHRRDVGKSRKLYRWARDNGFPDLLQVLCRNCNFGKYLNDGVCPHALRRRPS